MRLDSPAPGAILTTGQSCLQKDLEYALRSRIIWQEKYSTTLLADYPLLSEMPIQLGISAGTQCTLGYLDFAPAPQ